MSDTTPKSLLDAIVHRPLVGDGAMGNAAARGRSSDRSLCRTLEPHLIELGLGLQMIAATLAVAAAAMDYRRSRFWYRLFRLAR